MKTFSRRRMFHTALTVGVALLLVFLVHLLRESLRPAAIYTGFLLLAVVLALTLFNARKKVPFLPLFKASTWLQIHIYAGLLSVLVFLLHVNFRVPTGRLEIILAILFSVVALSGFVGLFLSRWLPARMTRSGENLVYERIPGFRNVLVERVEKVVLEAEQDTGSSVIGDYYLAELSGYFRGRPSLLILFGDPLNLQVNMQTKMDDFSRYLSEKERKIVAQLRDFIAQKQNLDFQWAAQRLLKMWLFIHIPFTYGLLVAAFVHAWVALSFGGSY